MNEIPALDDWISLTEAASIMGVTRQYVHKLTQQGVFHTLHKIPGARDVLVVERAEVQKLRGIRDSGARPSAGPTLLLPMSKDEELLERSEAIIADIQKHLNVDN